MYLERDGQTFLPVSQEVYDGLWIAVNDEPVPKAGFMHLTIGGVTIVADTPGFREWIAKGKK